jgi:hypothetical protein
MKTGLGRSRNDPRSPHGGNFCRPEGGGETKLFPIIVNVLGHPKGVGGLTSNFLCGGGMDVFCRHCSQLSTILNNIMLHPIQAQQYCSILLTSVNNMGSKTLFNPVELRDQSFFPCRLTR